MNVEDPLVGERSDLFSMNVEDYLRVSCEEQTLAEHVFSKTNNPSTKTMIPLSLLPQQY